MDCWGRKAAGQVIHRQFEADKSRQRGWSRGDAGVSSCNPSDRLAPNSSTFRVPPAATFGSEKASFDPRSYAWEQMYWYKYQEDRWCVPTVPVPMCASRLIVRSPWFIKPPYPRYDNSIGRYIRNIGTMGSEAAKNHRSYRVPNCAVCAYLLPGTKKNPAEAGLL